MQFQPDAKNRKGRACLGTDQANRSNPKKVSNANKGKEPAFFSNEDSGTMTLFFHDRAVYIASSGRRVTLLRYRGPIVLRGFCA
jgi:hypothetical protein